jgi:hypothetical protein
MCAWAVTAPSGSGFTIGHIGGIECALGEARDDRTE